MKRKLLRTMMALTATATVFSVLLLAAGPAASPGLVRPATPITLIGADPAVVDPAIDAAEPAAGVRQRHQLHRARALLALPYFSFAQGLRRGRS